MAGVSSDDELTREIAPAMLGKLKRDGQTKGVLLALAFSFLVQMANRLIVEQLSGVMPVVIATSAVALAALIVLPLYMRRRNVSMEVVYRREHGKWRWER